MQRRVLLGQVLGVQADQLREEQVQQRPGVGQPVRRDAHVDRHAAAPHVLEPEVVGAGGRIDHRIRKDRQRRVEGGDHAGQRVLGVRQQALQRIGAFVRQRVALFAPLRDQIAQVVLQRPALARGLAQHLADRARQRRGFEQDEAEAQEQVARLVVEEGFGRGAAAVVREEDLADGQQVADAVQRAGAHGGQRVPAVAARVLVEGREGVDGLAVCGAVAGRDVVVLALDVEHHDRVGPVQQVRDHDADALAAAGGRRQHHRELAGQGEEAATVAADQDAGLAVVAGEARALDLGGVREARIAMQRAARPCGGDQCAGSTISSPTPDSAIAS